MLRQAQSDNHTEVVEGNHPERNGNVTLSFSKG